MRQTDRQRQRKREKRERETKTETETERQRENDDTDSLLINVPFRHPPALKIHTDYRTEYFVIHI